MNPDLLYADTDSGLFATVDGGQRWEAFTEGLPHVPVQAKSGELVAATHGRSMFVATVAALQQWTGKVREQAAHLFDVPKQKAAAWWKHDRPTWFTPAEADPLPLWFHLKAAGAAELRLKDAQGALQRRWRLPGRAGLNRVDWDLQVDRAALPGLPEGRRPFIRPGVYTLELEVVGRVLVRKVEVESAREE